MEDRASLHLSMRRPVIKKLRFQSLIENRTQSDIVASALDLYFERYQHEHLSASLGKEGQE